MTDSPRQKVGRNDLCPCGSGRKYKKCCLLAQEATAAPMPQEPPMEGGLRSDVAYTPYVIACLAEEKLAPGRGLVRPGMCSPYGMAKLAEDPASAGADRRLRSLIQGHVRDGWTLRRVAAMSTEAIEEQLRRFGVQHSQARFLRLAEDRTSAWSLTKVWEGEDPLTCRSKSGDIDFLGLAACELWKRWLPERPSIEMLDDWMQEGYRLVEARRPADACECWWRMWCALRPRFTPAMRTMDDTKAVFDGLQLLGNWVQDLEMELLNAARKDRRLADRGRQLCQEWLAQFPDESDNQRMFFRKALATFLSGLGHGAEGLRILEENIERWPDDPWTYIHAADAYVDFFGEFDGVQRDCRKAAAILKRGLARVPSKAQDYDQLTERLKELPTDPTP